MADVTGPISTLVGAIHRLPHGMMCDSHPNVPAVARVQGETDSMGSEMWDVCQVCLDELRAYNNEEREERCDWCKNYRTGLRYTRDYDEGSCGPVYRVCMPCRKKANDAALEELKEYELYNGSGWDDDWNDDWEDDHHLYLENDNVETRQAGFYSVKFVDVTQPSAVLLWQRNSWWWSPNMQEHDYVSEKLIEKVGKFLAPFNTFIPNEENS